MIMFAIVFSKYLIILKNLVEINFWEFSINIPMFVIIDNKIDINMIIDS